MKIHFGLVYNAGDYEMPLICCDKTLCGLTSEIPCEDAVDDWSEVTCKKCLKLKDVYIKSCEEDEKIIVKQMGEMAYFFEELRNKELKK